MPALDSRAIMKTHYDVISQPCGARDWDALRELYHPRATMTRTGVAIESLPTDQCMTFDEYVENAEASLAGAIFKEFEIGHDCAQFGAVAQIRSTYETVYLVGDREIRARGVNFLTLARLDGRWQIITIAWDNERAGLTIPDDWLDEA